MTESNSTQPPQIERPTPSILESLEDTGLDFGFLTDLTLKTVYSDTNCTTVGVAEKLKLPVSITGDLLQHLVRDRFIENRGQVTFQNNRYGMLDRGWERAHRVLEVSGYIGPAPVSLNSYNDMVQLQEKTEEPINSESVRAAFSHLVLPESTIQTLGLVVNSRRSLFMTGLPGNGKTSIAKALHSTSGGEIWIPYAIEVEGQVIKVFDSYNHEPINPQPSVKHDGRWVKILRPLVIVGGELMIESMDLAYNQTVRYYEAPIQMRSNGGTLIIDDFGRQRIEPRDLLNRWIIPLEGKVDYLTLHTGKTIQIPFEQLLIFSTNLDPHELVDDAFLRRMGYRLRVDPPSVEEYALIFQRYVESHGLNFDRNLLDRLLMRYQQDQRRMNSCEPHDLIERCFDISRYENRPLTLTPDLLELAWDNYFGTKDS